MNKTDVVIIGAGPIGLELAVELKAAGVDYLHFEARQVGHTISGFPHQVRFFSSPERIAIAGVPLVTPDQSKATREEYLAYLRGIVEQFDLSIRTYEEVTAIESRGVSRSGTTERAGASEGFIVRTNRRGVQDAVACRRIVLATGDMAAPRRLGIPGEDLPHVSHVFDEPHRYFRTRLLIVGGRNSAVEAAIRCHRAGARVCLSYRRGDFDPRSVKYWLLPEIESFIRQGHIAFHPGTVPVEITPSDVALKRTDGEERVRVPADFVLLLVGYVCDTRLFSMAGVALEGENQGPVYNPETMETNVPGIFVAGTAAAGTQHHFRLFIENAHAHVDRIVGTLTGRPVRERITRGFTLPES